MTPPATAGLGAGACALREAGREPEPEPEPEPKPEPELERRPLRGAGVSIITHRYVMELCINHVNLCERVEGVGSLTLTW